MGEKRISDNAGIDAALQLDGDPENVRQYYADWAKQYNRDVGSADYSGPRMAADLLHRHLPNESAQLLDAGCGTGLVGIELRERGYLRIDGFDLSPEMAQQAQATGAYERVTGDIDIMRVTTDYPHRGYHALLCVGVFTLGHIPPHALIELLALVRENGLLVVSARSHYYDEGEFQPCIDGLLAADRIEELQVVWNAPYNHDGDAHYWVLRKCGGHDE